MAIQSTMGPSGEIYVTKTAFYWSMGIIILLLAAITFSMTSDISRLATTARISAPAVERTAPPVTSESELPPLPPEPEDAGRNPAADTNLRNQKVETLNPDVNPPNVNTNSGAGNTQ